MTRLYQWLRAHANLLDRTIFTGERRRSVRVEMTVQQERRFVRMTTEGLAAVDVCPLCGGRIEIPRGPHTGNKPAPGLILLFPAPPSSETADSHPSQALDQTILSTPKERT